MILKRIPNGINRCIIYQKIHGYSQYYRSRIPEFLIYSIIQRTSFRFQMHGFDYRPGSSVGMPSHPSNSGPLGPPPMGHMGPHGQPPGNSGSEGMYQPPPPGLENPGHIPPPMRDSMGMGPNIGSGRPIIGESGSMMSPPDGYMADNIGIGSGHPPPNALCGIENNSMIQPPLEPSGYTLTSLDTNSPMGSES